MTNGWLLVAVHVTDCVFAVTCKEPVAPDASAFTLLGLTEICAGLDEACCDTVNGWPTPLSGVTVMVAVRALAVMLAAPFHCTVPDPMPVAPDAIVNQSWLLTATHCSEGSSVKIVIEPVRPDASRFADEGLMLRIPPNCVTTSVCALPEDGVTVTLATRLVAAGLPATE